MSEAFFPQTDSFLSHFISLNSNMTGCKNISPQRHAFSLYSLQIYIYIFNECKPVKNMAFMNYGQVYKQDPTL